MPLDLSWIERIHARMLVRYGAQWINQWKDIDPDVLKQDWANELEGVSADGIRHALDNLPPDRPPTLGQFRLACINRPRAFLPGLPPPEVSEERKEEVRQMLARAKAAVTGAKR